MHKREQGKENDKQMNARGKEKKIKNSRKRKKEETTELWKVRMQRKRRISREDKWTENLYLFKLCNAANMIKKI